MLRHAMRRQLPGRSAISGVNTSFQLFAGDLIDPVSAMKFTNFMMFCGVVVKTFSGSLIIASTKSGLSEDVVGLDVEFSRAPRIALDDLRRLIHRIQDRARRLGVLFNELLRCPCGAVGRGSTEDRVGIQGAAESRRRFLLIIGRSGEVRRDLGPAGLHRRHGVRVGQRHGEGIELGVLVLAERLGCEHAQNNSLHRHPRHQGDAVGLLEILHALIFGSRVISTAGIELSAERPT